MTNPLYLHFSRLDRKGSSSNDLNPEVSWNQVDVNFSPNCTPFLSLAWASPEVQLANNPPATQETPVRFLDWEDPLEEGKVTHSSILAWRIPWTV